MFARKIFSFTGDDVRMEFRKFDSCEFHSLYSLPNTVDPKGKDRREAFPPQVFFGGLYPVLLTF
jgi:hypothetical protein